MSAAHHSVKPGIIPACAGSTVPTMRTWCRGWDHPRVRGEHRMRELNAEIDRGSSPRARGAQADLGGSVEQWGIIPACAGST